MLNAKKPLATGAPPEAEQQKALAEMLLRTRARYNVADAETGYGVAVAVDVLARQVGEEPATAAYHLEEAPA